MALTQMSGKEYGEALAHHKQTGKKKGRKHTASTQEKQTLERNSIYKDVAVLFQLL